MNDIRKELEDAFWGVKNRYVILQLKDEPEYREEWFLSLNELKDCGKEPSLDHYKFVYSGGLPYIPGSKDEFLEYLYYKFNADIPKDFEGHSLSVSDVVVIKDSVSTEAYYVDAIGFTQLSNFL